MRRREAARIDGVRHVGGGDRATKARTKFLGNGAAGAEEPIDALQRRLEQTQGEARRLEEHMDIGAGRQFQKSRHMEARGRPQSDGGEPVQGMEMRDDRACVAGLLEFVAEFAKRSQDGSRGERAGMLPQFGRLTIGENSQRRTERDQGAGERDRLAFVAAGAVDARHDEIDRADIHAESITRRSLAKVGRSENSFSTSCRPCWPMRWRRSGSLSNCDR